VLDVKSVNGCLPDTGLSRSSRKLQGLGEVCVADRLEK
jgi:hypothetical protein